jgi:pimeloyl-ACP methyl ester carboxylesterase
MTQIAVPGMTLEVQSHGDMGAPSVVLVAGFTQQLTDWDDAFIDGLIAIGMHVVRFDNRDVGMSGRATETYLLADLAADTVGVLDALGLADAHLLGVSMGGMIAQQVAISYPDRVRSLTSVMSTTGRRADSVSTPEAAAVLASGTSHSEAEFVAQRQEFARVCGSPAYPTDPAVIAERARVGWSRGYDAEGVLRQFRAIFAPRQDRTEGLQSLRIPALVIHGAEDPLIAPIGGEATAAAIPGAELWIIPGMGHDLPSQLNGQLIERLRSFWL